MSTKEAVRLPELETLELADFKAGSLGSDLNAIRSTVETVAQVGWLDRFNMARASGEVSTFDEWVASQPEGENDEERALRLVAFATDAVGHLASLLEDAKAIRTHALTLYQEARPNYSSAGRGRIVEWADEWGDWYRREEGQHA
jgi:hypothetical protein